jgi:hypothetical protein
MDINIAKLQIGKMGKKIELTGSGVPRGGVWDVQTTPPPPEIPKF